MTLTSGTRIGVYEVVAKIGAGGMGEVYRAHDTRLNRDVALKVLPEVFSRDMERMARFEREAKVLASLNHTNIAAIYGFEESGPIHALVMELVEGPTLAERIRGGAIPVDEAIPIARQVADAVEYAHDKNVIHRDLKPANIKVTTDGTVKVLDFGLAKALSDEVAAEDMSNSPTLSMAATRQGVILGTAAYMSPEQAKGKTVDRRTDVWAFGCVFYEMLSGKQAFEGDDVTEILAAVVRAEPDWNRLPATTPLTIRNLVRRCLAKDVRQRLQHIGEARFVLEHVADALGEPVAPQRKTRELLLASIAAIAIVAALVLAFGNFKREPADQAATKLSIMPSANAAFSSDSAPAISPDGRRLAFVARDSAGKVLIWVRPLDSLTPQPLAGTEDAHQPFWSPDSRFLGFFSQGKLKKTDASGGPPQILCNASSNPFGGTWSQDGVIAFALNAVSPIETVSASGGLAKPATTLDLSREDRRHAFPHFLPDGRHFLYLVVSGKRENSGIYVGSLDSRDTKRLSDVSSEARYAPPGYLLFIRDGTLMAQPFDASRLELSGDPFPVAEQVASDPIFGDAMFSVSGNGVLVYHGGAGSTDSQLMWFDSTGKLLERIGAPGEYRNLELSPDGKRVAFERRSTQGDRDLWLMELAGGTPRRFTFNPSEDYFPIWSSDGTQIAFASNRDGSFGLYRKPTSGVGTEEALLKSSVDVAPYSWSSDGRLLVYRSVGAKGYTEAWVLPLVGDRKPFPFLQAEFNQSGPKLSPDGKWLADYSNQSGTFEVYIQSFPTPGGKWQVTTAGGVYARWSRNGKELLYIALDGKLMMVTVKGDSALEVGTPKALFEPRIVGGARTVLGFRNQFDVAPDGRRFLLNVPVAEESALPITLVQNWTAGLKE